MSEQPSSFLTYLFFLIPLVLPLLVGGFLHNLSERIDDDETAPAKKLSSRERAGDVADQHAMKVKRERVRREDASPEEADHSPASSAAPKAALAETDPAEFEIPADFNLAEYSGREASPTA